MSSPAAHTLADAPDAPVCESRAGAGSELEQSEGEDEALTPLSLLFARGFAAHRAVEAGSAPEVRACWVPLLWPQTLREAFWRSTGGGCGWRGGTASRGGGRARARRLLAQRARGGRGHGGPQVPPRPLPASRGAPPSSPFRARLAARSHLSLQLLVQLRVQERAPLVSGARLTGRALLALARMAAHVTALPHRGAARAGPLPGAV